MVGGLYALLATALAIVYKSTNVLSLVHGQLVVAGAFLCWTFLVPFGLPIYLSLLLTFIIMAVVGLVLERYTMRPLIGQPIIAAVVMTIALFALLHGILWMIWGGRMEVYPEIIPSAAIILGKLRISPAYLWSFVIAILCVIGFTVFFRFTKAGLNMRATAEDHRLAQSTGIMVKGVFSQSWIISAVIAGIGGILLGFLQGVQPALADVGMKALVVILIGGLDSIPGAIVGGLLLGILESVACGYIDPLVGGGTREVFAYAMLVIILLFKPYGLFGLKRIERI